MKRIAADEAEARAAWWKVQLEEKLCALSSDYHRDATAGDLLEMWRHWRNLTKRPMQADRRFPMPTRIATAELIAGSRSPI
jgi:hypothetical protein